MKRIVVLLMLLLIVPPMTALAASVTSKSFVVRNWMATLPTTPASTDEVEQEEPEEHGEMESEEHSEPGEQPIPPAFTDELETDGQPAIPIFTTPFSPDEVEMDEQSELVGEVEGQDGPVDDHSGEEPEAPQEME